MHQASPPIRISMAVETEQQKILTAKLEQRARVQKTHPARLWQQIINSIPELNEKLKNG